MDGKNKTINDLTESEKQTITALSQLAGGLAGGLVGNNTASAVNSAEIGKRAVENNFLSLREQNELERLSKKKILTYAEALRVVHLMKKDIDSDKLLIQYQAQFNGGKTLEHIEFNKLFQWVNSYGDIKDQLTLLDIPANAPQLKADYSDLLNKANKIISYEDRYDSKQSESLNQGLNLAAGVGINSAIINTVKTLRMKNKNDSKKNSLIK